MFTWPIKWILKRVLVVVIPALIAIGLLDLAGVDVESFINDLLGELGFGEEETTFDYYAGIKYNDEWLNSEENRLAAYRSGTRETAVVSV